MKRFISAFAIIILSISVCAQAQEVASIPARAQSFVEAGIGFNANHTITTAGYYRHWRLSQSKPFFDKFFIGTGLRFNGFGAKDVRFVSAPPALYKTFGADSILTPSPAIYTTNIFLNLGYQITARMQAGFDIDVFGLSFGPNGSPTFISNGVPQTAKVNPTPVNVLLVGANNRGSLLSNLYLRYKISDRWGARVSYQTFYAEITTEELLQIMPENNKRFRHTTKVFALGANYHFR